ncbi:BT4734/BF3469 family protein [uncultured Bacteroides sp.]|uniref:BT4734/BF3469 family protein n=1 Tax=uncultured Bacteroides sp. TaxID=162156 RepID=UPI002AA8B509|nr:BT4734/BF3469 family protein [uncultured Bacteroides sp.]
MKITQCRENGKTQTQRAIELTAVVEAMKTETQSQPVSNMRMALQHTMPGRICPQVKMVPKLIFGGSFSENGGVQLMTGYNGWVTIEVNNLTGHSEAAQIRERASRLPQTLLAFIGSSNKSVKIIVPFSLMDGSLPQRTQLAEMFHAQAYREAVKWYQPQLKREIELKKPALNHSCRMSFDPGLYHNPEAMPIRIEQPVRMPAESTFEEERQAVSDPLQRLLPGYERSRVISTLFNTSMQDALNSVGGVDYENGELLPFLVKLAENCNRSGIPEEDAVRWTLLHTGLRKYDLEIRANFRAAYTLAKKFGSKPCISSSMTLVAQMEEFMQRRYQLRRNTVKGVVEYRELKSFYFDFRPLNKQAINSICINALGEGLPLWDADVKRYLESDRVPSYDPVEEYLLNLGAWDGKDRIRELADRVPCDNPQWRNLFYIWFLSMVAHWQQLDREHSNSTLPLLVGSQGCGKSTFCLNLLPPELRDYYTDSIDFSKRNDVQLALSRFALINMDEFDSISPSYQGFMKHILQKAVVQTRLPHASVTQQLRRYATFIATCNNFDLLTDSTGSRRYIGIEVIGVIDYQSPVDYSQLYAQAVNALHNRERYWFTHEEEAYITESNRRFQRVTPQEESVDMYFSAPQEGEPFEELTCTEILDRIRQRNSTFKCSDNAAMSLGRSLITKFERRHIHRGYVYKVTEIK